MSKCIISPIAIDLGAKNTGVYFAHYPAGSSLDVFNQEGTKEGKVYQLDSNNYTYLMANRTAKRHQRRGYDRRQMAKRLFKLIWEQHLGLEWDKNVQQTIGFLMNRRGFSFLNEEYDAKVLSQFPQEAFDKLPDELADELKKKKEVVRNGDSYDFASALIRWANEGGNKIKTMLEALDQEPKKIRKRLTFISKTNKLREYCSKRKKDEKIPEEKKRANLSRLSKWILEEWIEEGIQGLPDVLPENTIDIVKYLNEEEPKTAVKILQELPDLSEEQKSLKKSIWNFGTEQFDMEKADFDEKMKDHLHHLAFALYKIHSELESGGRHRSKYFEEVKTVLGSNVHNHGYLKRFCTILQKKGYGKLNADNLSNLIGHISNLELKPLRKYFNDPKHKQGDFWCESRITKRFGHWILAEWRVNPQNDKYKAEGAEYDYGKLRKKWKERTEGLVDFWLKTPPGWTIPPYQNNNNRRPPKCQSLIFNVNFLNSKYQDWQQWLGELKKLKSVRDYLDDYEEKLKELESGKEKGYFSDDHTGKLLKDSGRRSMEELNARVLQFIFDRVKDEDPLNLNEIYSYAKKYRQESSSGEERAKAKKGVEYAIKRSCLPIKLRTERNYKKDKDNSVFEDGTFLHLVCKYYKQRQRARDGRIYIHPKYHFIEGRYENTGRFDDKNHLLTYCNHKPRQKRYQLLGDLAGLLQVAPQRLKKFSEKQEGESTDNKLFNWLNGIDTLKTNCTTASTEQKKRQGRLKLDIQSVFGLIYHRKKVASPSDREIKSILESSRVDNASELYSFCNRAKSLCTTLTENLYDDLEQKKWKEDLDKNPATAVYLLAQINNITFKERGGNASTCPVCSTDNAFRMQTISTSDGKDTTVKAQRLPAIPTRIIDGAVRRMARIVGGAIAKNKWRKIEKDLKAGKQVYVPIITESNRFEFEPSKDELVRGQRIKARKGEVTERGGEDKIFESVKRNLTTKDERIKAAGQGICPYTGKPSSDGDKDHIIPRSSEWGTLNDEANFMWASDRGNKEIKRENTFYLRNIKPEYKKCQFDTTDDNEIQEWIIEQIGDGGSENFKFGKYRNFINLTPEQQKAFRHALFLNHPLRDRVINAINNRSRTLVNGTQRYFAEVLANILYKKAKRIGKENLLSFDYYGVEAQSNTRGDGVYDLRKLYEECDHEISKYAKSRDTKQQAYSHLIDAQLAFVIVADAHRKGGGIKLQIDDSVRKEPYDENTGEIYDDILKYIQVPDQKFKENIEKLARKKPNEDFSSHRSFTRDTYYADHYLPILLKRENGAIAAKIGFNWTNSAKIETDTKKQNNELLKKLTQILPLCNDNQYLVVNQYASLDDLFAAMENSEHFSKQLKKNSYCYLTVNKRKLHEYWRKQYNTKNGEPFNNEFNDFLCKTLRYMTERKSISEPEDLLKELSNDKNFKHKIKQKSIELPVKTQWKACRKAWERAENEMPFDEFLKDYFSPRTRHNHQRVRKVFSLPVLTTQGKFILRRKSWTGDSTYQIINDSDSRSPDNKPNVPIRRQDGTRGIKLAKWAQSKNFIKPSTKDNYDVGKAIDPSKYYLVDRHNAKLPDQVEDLWYRIDDSTAPTIAIKLAKNGSDINDAEFMEEDICKHGFRKQKAKTETTNRPAQPEKSPQDVRDDFFNKKIKPAKKGEIIKYKGAAYNNKMNEAFKIARLVDELK